MARQRRGRAALARQSAGFSPFGNPAADELTELNERIAGLISPAGSAGLSKDAARVARAEAETGILSGPIKRKLAEGAGERIAAAGRKATAVTELGAVTAADTQIAASGIDVSQLSAGREAGLQRLGVDDPGQLQAALNEIQQGQAIDLTPVQQSQLDRAAAEQLRTEQAIEFNAQLQPFKVNQAESDAIKARVEAADALNLSPIQLAQAETNLASSQLQLTQDEIAAGAVPVAVLPNTVAARNPFTGGLQNVNIGGPVYTALQTQSDSLARVMENSNQMQVMIQEMGTEFASADARRMSAMLASMKFDYAVAKGAGALTGPDLDLIEAGLLDPTSFFRNLASILKSPFPGAIAQERGAMVAGYNQFSVELSRQIKDMVTAEPALRIDVDALDPSVFKSANEIDFYRANSGTVWMQGP